LYLNQTTSAREKQEETKATKRNETEISFTLVKFYRWSLFISDRKSFARVKYRQQQIYENCEKI
jgi:hypothetical protein